MKFNQILFILLCFSSAFASAEECPEVRMDESEGSMEYIPVRTQYLGTCYTYAAIEAYDALRFSLNPSSDKSLLSHPLYASLTAKEYMSSRHIKSYEEGKEAFIEGGDPFGLLKRLIEGGSCLSQFNDSSLLLGVFDKEKHEGESVFQTKYLHRKYLNSIMHYYSELSQKMTRQSIEILGKELEKDQHDYYSVAIDNTRVAIQRPYFDRDFKTSKDYYEEAIDKQIRDLKKKYNDDLINTGNEMFESGINAGMDSISSRNFSNVFIERGKKYAYRSQDFIKSLKEDETDAKMMKEDLFKGCLKSNPLPQKYKFYASSSDKNLSDKDEDIVKKINSFLSSKTTIKKQPILSHICHTIMFQKDYDGILDRKKYEYDKNCLAHAVLIIGSRKNPDTNKCEYLVRNSWGSVKNSKTYPKTEDNYSQWIEQQSFAKNIKNFSLYY